MTCPDTTHATTLIVKQVLFDWNKKHGHSSAVVWALEHGRTDTLEDCRAFGLNLLTPGSHHHTNALNRHFDLEAPFCCQTPIGMAFSYHQPAAVKWLLDEEGVSVDQLCSAVDQVAPFNAATALIPADKEEYAPRWSALEYALGHRASSVATLLIQKGATLTFTHKAQDRGVKQQHAIYIAAEKGLIDVIKTLVHERHVNVNATDADGETPLHHAVGVLGNKETILGLVDLGADLNQPAANGVTPLLKALQTGCYANAFELINAGADIKPIPGLLSPLRACLSNQPRDRFSLVGAIWLNLDDKYYLGHEPDEDEKADVFRGRVLEMLLEKGASVHDEYADEPMPPILTALHHYQERTILFHCGVARLDDPYDEERTVLQEVVARGIPYILSGMLEMGRYLVDPEHLRQVIYDRGCNGDRKAINVFSRVQVGVAWVDDDDRTELLVL
ncbi:hypothetical protein PG988_000826 [Apiospora saccharicola]